jgi:hypothetical protein
MMQLKLRAGSRWHPVVFRYVVMSLTDAKKTGMKPSTGVLVFTFSSAHTFLEEFHMAPFHVYLLGKNQGPIETSFEDAERRLKDLPLLHFEPDGSFVWILEAGKEQIYGMLYDAAGKLRYCDLQGHCTEATWVRLREAITGGRNEGLMVSLLIENELQDLQSFEKSLPPAG